MLCICLDPIISFLDYFCIQVLVAALVQQNLETLSVVHKESDLISSQRRVVLLVHSESDCISSHRDWFC